MQTVISPFVMVIFGATGDLTARKLMPALYNLLADKVLPEQFLVVGFARRNYTDSDFRYLMRKAVVKFSRRKRIDARTWNILENNLFYQQGYFEDNHPYQQLIELLAKFDKKMGACITRFFYLATPPQNYSTILSKLDTTKLAEGCGQGSSKWTRVLIEKPFGKDLETARSLEDQLSETFEERQIYRIDHYLAKETVQNILVFRFANRLIEPLWSHEHIDHLQITLAESSGVGSRGKFYEGVGALRDVAQNHLMAMLAYTTMEEPKSFTAADIRAERVNVLSKLRSFEPEEVAFNVVRGQYGSSVVMDKQISGYRQEKDIDPKSVTETYVALKTYIDTDRFANVPIYLRTGKRLKQNAVQIDIQFKKPSSKLYQELADGKSTQAGLLTFRVQPKEGISLRFFAKVPTLTAEIEPVDMNFSYSSSFKKDVIDSYEKILLDTMIGDQTLFATRSGFQATWKLATKIMQGWKKLPPPKFPNYNAGSWGPKEAEDLIKKDGREWIIS